MFRRLLNVVRRPLAFYTLLASQTLLKPVKCEKEAQMTQEEQFLQRKKMMEVVNRNLVKYEVGPATQFEEGKIYPFTIKNGDHDYKIILVKFNGRIYALSSTCTYDQETDLSLGICFGNKLYCPKHGCQFDITNGWADQAPAFDYLPQFYIEERNGIVSVLAPKIVPKKILPQFSYRNYNDMRKIVIVGCKSVKFLIIISKAGVSAFACVQTLRECSYTGQIVVVTKDNHFPYDKTQLTKKIKNVKPENFYMRDQNWYAINDIEIIFNNPCVMINNKHQNTYIELEDGFRIDYDGLLIATGTETMHKDIQGLKDAKNLLYLDNINDHQKLQSTLESIKNIVTYQIDYFFNQTLIGINQQSLETASTIRKEYPNVEVTLVDFNKNNFYESFYGPEISNVLIDLHVKNGVKVIEKSELVRVDKTKNQNELIFEDGYKHQTEALLLFPNLRMADTVKLCKRNDLLGFHGIE